MLIIEIMCQTKIKYTFVLDVDGRAPVGKRAFATPTRIERASERSSRPPTFRQLHEEQKSAHYQC